MDKEDAKNIKEPNVTHALRRLMLLLSCFSHVQLCATTQMAAHQALLSLGFSRQEYWSGLPFPSPMHACMLSRFNRVRLCDLMDSSPPGSSVPGILQARILEWVAISFSRNLWHGPQVLSYCSVKYHRKFVLVPQSFPLLLFRYTSSESQVTSQHLLLGNPLLSSPMTCQSCVWNIRFLGDLPVTWPPQLIFMHVGKGEVLNFCSNYNHIASYLTVIQGRDDMATMVVVQSLSHVQLLGHHRPQPARLLRP